MKITNVRIRSIEGRMPAELDKYDIALGQKQRVPKDVTIGYEAPFMPIKPAIINQDNTITKHADFLYIETDEGITGVAGPLATPFPHQNVTSDIYQFAQIIKGEDPYNTNRIWELMYRTCLKVGYRELRAISAIDIALWDIKCKASNLPLYKMLGGKTQEMLPSYASTVGTAYINGSIDLEQVKEYTKKSIAEGYIGAKWFVHRGPSDGEKGVRDMVELIKTIREVSGPEYRIMLDCWCGWTYEFTMRVSEQIKEYDIFFIEEPLLPVQVDQVAKLSQDCPIRIALGEHLTTKYDFLRQIKAGFKGLFQPEVYWMGGVSEFKTVMGLLTTYDFSVSPHGVCPPICMQLSAAYPINVIPVSEYLVNMMEAIQYFYKYPARPIRGKFIISNQVGCNLDVDDSKVQKETWVDL